MVFQVLGTDAPAWREDGAPLAWSADDYKRWTARVWRPARQRAAKAPDAAGGVATMRFYDLRHTAISIALHSTLVMTRHGMDLHNLAAWAGHDVRTSRRANPIRAAPRATPRYESDADESVARP